MDVVFKEGTLYLQGVKFGKRTWKKTWVVLFKPSSSGIGRVELYSKPTQRKLSEKRVVRLCDCLSVTPAPEESCPPGCRALYLNTTQTTYVLASTTCQEWLTALCHLAFQREPGELNKGVLEEGTGLPMEDNDLYSSWKTGLTLHPNQHHVTVQTTEASRRCKLAGDYLFSSDTEAVLLLDIHTGQIIYRWPYRLLRRFGQCKGGFSIEAGHRCDSGEGMFTFLSPQGPKIYQAIVKQCSVEGKTKNPPVQTPSVYKTAQQPTLTSQSPNPPVCSPPDVLADTKVEIDSELYATIDSSPSVIKKSFAIRPHLPNSIDTEGEEGEDEDELCQFLEPQNLDDVGEDGIYHNLRRPEVLTTLKSQTEPESDLSESIYSVLKISEAPSQPQLPPLPKPPSLPPSRPLSFSLFPPPPPPPPVSQPPLPPLSTPSSLSLSHPPPPSVSQPLSLYLCSPPSPPLSQPSSLPLSQPSCLSLPWPALPPPLSLPPSLPLSQSSPPCLSWPPTPPLRAPAFTPPFQPPSLPPSQPVSLPLSHPLSKPNPHLQLQSFSYTPSNPRYQPQSLVMQPWYQPQDPDQTQAYAGDETKGVEETKSSRSGTPTEMPVSFKQKLSEIIAKDLAKLQNPLPN